jgi:hypothetical protein
MNKQIAVTDSTQIKHRLALTDKRQIRENRDKCRNFLKFLPPDAFFASSLVAPNYAPQSSFLRNFALSGFVQAAAGLDEFFEFVAGMKRHNATRFDRNGFASARIAAGALGFVA